VNKSIGVGRWVISFGLIWLLLAGTVQAQFLGAHTPGDFVPPMADIYLYGSTDGVELKIP